MAGKLKIYNGSTSSWDYAGEGVSDNSTDTISEATTDAGVTIDGLNIKDNFLVNPYKFRAILTTAQASVASGTQQDIIFDQDSSTIYASYDTNNNYSTSTGEYTIPVSGYYDFYGQYLAYYGGTVFGSPRIYIYIQVKPSGGSYATGASNMAMPDASTTTRHTTNTSYSAYLNAGDMVKCVALIYYSSGAPYVNGDSAGQYSYFQGRLISK
mgnify:CR=1 FL=1